MLLHMCLFARHLTARQCTLAETETARDDATTAAAKLRAGMDLALAETTELRGLLNPEP
jgi:hypothetical protein